MFFVLKKDRLWDYLEGLPYKQPCQSLKDMQDTFVLYHARNCSSARICEVGGGDSRLLPKIKNDNECWNIDRMEGQGQGPTAPKKIAGVKYVPAFMGEYSSDIPDNYFDLVVSVSVVEHIPGGNYADAMKDCFRVLRPGGKMLHAIDLYLFDADADEPHQKSQQNRIDLYSRTCDILGGQASWIEAPETDSSVRASATHATNSMQVLQAWNRINPRLKTVRSLAQSSALCLGVQKAG